MWRGAAGAGTKAKRIRLEMVGRRPKNSAEPGPERPATQWQERETKAKRIRLEMVGRRPENSAEPGPERPATQWQERETWLYFCRGRRSPTGAGAKTRCRQGTRRAGRRCTRGIRRHSHDDGEHHDDSVRGGRRGEQLGSRPRGAVVWRCGRSSSSHHRNRLCSMGYRTNEAALE